MQKIYQFTYTEYNGIESLDEKIQKLFNLATLALEKSYSPYSNFKVGVSALLVNEQIITGANQENASYPVGICAERVVLSTVSSMYPSIPIHSLVVTYLNEKGQSNEPISPCGMCRQSLNEFEIRMNHPIRLYLGGNKGKILQFENCKYLLPFGFSNDNLGK